MRSLPFIALLFALLGCETVIEVDVPAHEERFAVSAVLTTADSMRVWVSHSVGVFEQDRLSTVQDATVTLFEGGTEIATAERRAVDFSGFSYAFYGLEPQPGAAYTLRFDVPDGRYPRAEATTQMPQPVSFDVRSRLTSREVPGGQELGYEITLTISDPPEGRTFYRIAFEEERFLTRLDSAITASVLFSTRDRSILNEYELSEVEQEREFFGYEAFFRDALFDGTAYRLALFLPLGSLIDPPTNPADLLTQRVFLVFDVVSEAYYEHRRTLRLYERNNDNPFAEPVPVFSNIENGYGIFGSTWRRRVAVP